MLVFLFNRLSEKERGRERDTVIEGADFILCELTEAPPEQYQAVAEGLEKMCCIHKQTLLRCTAAENRSYLFQENLIQMNCRLTRESADRTEEVASLKEENSILEQMLWDEQQKSSSIQKCTKALLESIQGSEETRYHHQLVQSIGDTLRQQSSLIEEQQEHYEEGRVNEEDLMGFEALTQEIDRLCAEEEDPFSSEGAIRSKEVPKSSLISLQHFGYLHEIISTQKEHILRLQEVSPIPFSLFQFQEPRSVPNPVTSPRLDNKTEEESVLEDQEHLKQQAERERASLSSHLAHLQQELNQHKRELSKLQGEG